MPQHNVPAMLNESLSNAKLAARNVQRAAAINDQGVLYKNIATSVLACEIAFKALYTYQKIERDPDNGHDLWKLFERLPLPDQQGIRTQFEALQGCGPSLALDAALKSWATAYESWQRSEAEKPSHLLVSAHPLLSNLAHAVILHLVSLAPQFTPLIERHRAALAGIGSVNLAFQGRTQTK